MLQLLLSELRPESKSAEPLLNGSLLSCLKFTKVSWISEEKNAAAQKKMTTKET